MSRSKSDYEEIAVVRDPDGLGLIAPITVFKKRNGYHSFSFTIMKEFERKEGAPVERSAWIGERHIEAAHKLLDLAASRIAEEQDKINAARRSGVV